MNRAKILAPSPDIRKIPVTEHNLWFLEKGIPLFEILDFFPPSAIGHPRYGKQNLPGKKGVLLTIETDQGWSFTTDIATDSKTFRNSSLTRGSGRWVKEAQLKPGDYIVLQRLGEYRYRLSHQKGGFWDGT